MRDGALFRIGQFIFRQSASKLFLPPCSACLGMISGGGFQPGGLLQIQKSDHRDDTTRPRAPGKVSRFGVKKSPPDALEGSNEGFFGRTYPVILSHKELLLFCKLKDI